MRIDNALFVVILFVKYSNFSSAGGIKDFTHQDSTYEKWVLNRPFQARMVDSLLSLAEIDKTANNPRKCLRATEIKKSEERVLKVVEALKEDFINPFDSALTSRSFSIWFPDDHSQPKFQSNSFHKSVEGKNYNLSSTSDWIQVTNQGLHLLIQSRK